MDLAQRIHALIEPTANDMGYDLIRVQLSGETRMMLQIMAERANGTGMGVDDCSKLSRAVSALLDVEDPIRGNFTLEVSSPGIDRPLVKLADFERFDGFEARIETLRPIEDRRRFKGLLKGVANETVSISTEDGDVTIPFVDISRAKLILTDELLAAAAEKGLS